MDGSGAGKSASYVIPNACQLLGSYVFTDPKGELYDLTAGYLREKGYKIKVLNLVRPQNSDGFNPLFHIQNEIDVDVIANTIVKGQTTEKSSDPYWDDMAEMLLKALIYYLIAARPKEEQNLASCSELVRAANKTGGDNLLSNLINQLPYDHPARMNYKSVEIASDKTYSSILSSLQSKLGKFDSKEIAELTSTNTIDFEEIGKEKTAVYVISSDTHAAYDFLLTIFFSQMIQRLYDFADTCGGQLPIPTYFILDEFANIGRIPDFDKKISTSRSRKISFSVILQNLDQLEAVYEKTYETIMGNCDTHVFLGSNSQKTVEYFSKALGEKTIFRESISVNKNERDWKTGKSISDQVMGRALLTPDELRRLDVDECIIYEKGLKPIRANKYYYYKYPTEKIIRPFRIDHNDREVPDRGKWRKYNPYNPYTEEDEHNKENTKIESLDDLFADVDGPKEEIVEEKKEELKLEATPVETKTPEPKKEQNEETKQELTDIQKELEAKFDELFGSLDD
ncbi:MAG: type IV secretory system conjugative DNA transfer family protein [Clostridia bacterium]|nr:type IV secretory system conjugative DNA transfer family protein [Clostridia bacterium]